MPHYVGLRLLSWVACLTALLSTAVLAESPEEIVLERPLGIRAQTPGFGGTVAPASTAVVTEFGPAGGSLPASGPQPNSFDATLPADAQGVLTQFRNHEAEQRAQLERQLQPARQNAIHQLEALQDRFTREGKLDEALAIRAQVRRLKAEQPGVIQDPGNLTSYRGRTGTVLLINVTGSTDGIVYGTGTYTDDSDVSTAAVHAGILKEGESDLVKVTLLPGQDAYEASSAHGISSYQYANWYGSYRLESTKLPKVTPRIPNEVRVPALPRRSHSELVDSLYGRGTIGERLTLKVRGTSDGFVWGSGTYTDDSSLGAAAVHAGVLDVGEVGTVTVRIEHGLNAYQGSTANGVTTRDYHRWSRSFSFVIEERR